MIRHLKQNASCELPRKIHPVDQVSPELILPFILQNMKYVASLLFASAALMVTSCAPAAKMPYQKDVRSMSATSNSMFAHMMGGIAGVAFVDEMIEGKTTGRELIRIDPLSNNNTSQAGKEKWTVQHAGGDRGTYIATWSGNQFEVKPEQRVKARN